ncbi:MAG: glycosyltransferase [Zetaproteobacteria bacterium CG06_land_8_20_14_3_00_59_53]|nr:MAG: glycosyltransferase [Zetaproteobacteria bacterium CG2_30_59_37]PIO89447.1 MAG: glycosyltransferase [Zetaproteobacteria bacterium CG23_combo_of_CG06-09_8_20_14_all_59_86]PIQ65472.1 MAG: glycosyltransferase [Zetaproteobacteria bacterium CG11_big_fil_rev_8_21_14_0_20_59_439]PIU69725.1 MAG: glycosyltransferase [Zetaproteobacteria bacterium CG06_land_8_20_14_3_00_59_53]PIU96973.1 MAG: glycosyltransferase [Zetaproteobacteria bacterium CG03_land_8_20_14_0_80_59_51]PIY47639.1 MAG: glycosyltran
MPLISVIIPVYKAEDCLHELYRRLVPALEGVSKDFEIVMVEDCGGDRSWDIIGELAKADTRVRGIQFSRNFGQHYGITAGLDYCTGDWAVVMDCDLQDAPEAIPELYAKAQEGFDVVLARRIMRKDGLRKTLGSRLFYKLFAYLADMDYDPEVGNFRIISRKVIDGCCSMRENLRFFGGMIDWLGFPTAKIDSEHGERFAGETSYTFASLLKLASNTIIAYSDKPLRLSVQFGFALAGLAFVAGIGLLIYASIYHVPIMGWSSLIVSLYFIGGVIIANLGIIGIYLGKTFDESKKRPLYVVMHDTAGTDA